MHNRFLRGAVVAGGLAALLASEIAAAQWVFLAKRAIGRVEQLSQQAQQPGAPSYDSAAVLLEVPTDKVYAAVLNGLRNAQGITITRQDAGASLVQFTNGQQIAGIKLSMLGDNLTHMLITSAHSGAQPDAAALVMNSVLRVCGEMKVECSRAQQ
jgi:hypothetical protein